MTTRKTTPHLKRGPKPKPKPKPRQSEPPKRKVGRPEMPLRDQPHRYALAYYEVYVTLGLSKRTAAVFLKAMEKGLFSVTDDGISISDPAAPIDLDDFFKDSERLRAQGKLHATRPDDLAWLMTMSEAIRIAFGPWHPEARDKVLRLAASVGETAWARQVLLPMLDEETAAPEIADNFSPT